MGKQTQMKTKHYKQALKEHALWAAEIGRQECAYYAQKMLSNPVETEIIIAILNDD